VVSDLTRETAFWLASVVHALTAPVLFFRRAPVVEHQLDVIASTHGLEQVALPKHIASNFSPEFRTEVRSLCFSGAGFRKVRMTCLDGTPGLQVFNSVWYPEETRDAPILGIDLLRFGPKNFLVVSDLQPIDKSEAYLQRYTRGAAAIRQRYPVLCGERSQRYYEDDRFFSDEMLYGRLKDEGDVGTDVLPAFREYLDYYINAVHTAAEDDSALSKAWVLRRQADYDKWNAERDPAHALFQKYFGDEWAHEYLTSFLFDQA